MHDDENGGFTINLVIEVTICAHVLQGPCASWVEKSCAAVLLQHFLMGFELDLYQPKEFCMLYWYILRTTLQGVCLFGTCSC